MADDDQQMRAVINRLAQEAYAYYARQGIPPAEVADEALWEYTQPRLTPEQYTLLSGGTCEQWQRWAVYANVLLVGAEMGRWEIEEAVRYLENAVATTSGVVADRARYTLYMVQWTKRQQAEVAN